MKLTPLRYLLFWDAALLIVLGAALILMPSEVQRIFHFNDRPAAMNYILGLWGCVLASLGLGYLVAAKDPVKNLVWVQVGIVRGALECILGLVYLARGLATFQQAGMAIVLTGLIAFGYVAFYPRGRSAAPAGS
jgi:hypothetical protein